MVTLCFKLSETGTVTLELDGPAPLDTLLHRYQKENDIELGGYIAIRDGEVLTAETVIGDGDRVEIFPALSGG